MRLKKSEKLKTYSSLYILLLWICYSCHRLLLDFFIQENPLSSDKYLKFQWWFIKQRCRYAYTHYSVECSNLNYTLLEFSDKIVTETDCKWPARNVNCRTWCPVLGKISISGAGFYRFFYGIFSGSVSEGNIDNSAKVRYGSMSRSCIFKNQAFVDFGM